MRLWLDIGMVVLINTAIVMCYDIFTTGLFLFYVILQHKKTNIPMISGISPILAIL